MNKVSTNISLDPILKENATKLFASFGLDLSTAISLFLTQSVREQAIPFKIRATIPNQTTLDALNEYVEMKNNPSKYKRYDSFDEVLKELK